jgi:hypothetical protein
MCFSLCKSPKRPFQILSGIVLNLFNRSTQLLHPMLQRETLRLSFPGLSHKDCLLCCLINMTGRSIFYQDLFLHDQMQPTVGFLHTHSTLLGVLITLSRPQSCMFLYTRNLEKGFLKLKINFVDLCPLTELVLLGSLVSD